MSGHGRTFEPDPDAGTGLLSPISYRLRNFAALPRLPASCAATRNFTSGKSHVRRAARASHGFKLFYSLSRRKTFVGGKCALPSALLVICLFSIIIVNIRQIHIRHTYLSLLIIITVFLFFWHFPSRTL